MPRGGRRPGSGRKPKSLALHKLEGTYQASRHAHRAASPTAAVLTMPRTAPAVDWQPSEAEWAELSPRARDWLTATLGLYVVNGLEGRQVLECCRVLSRCEVLEAEPGMAAAAALARERRLFWNMWTSLRFLEG